MIDFVIFVLAVIGGCFVADAVRERSPKLGALGIALIIGPTILRHLVGL